MKNVRILPNYLLNHFQNIFIEFVLPLIRAVIQWNVKLLTSKIRKEPAFRQDLLKENKMDQLKLIWDYQIQKINFNPMRVRIG